MAHLLRHFPVADIRFDPTLEFFSEWGTQRRITAAIDEDLQAQKKARNWLLVLWNRQAIKKSEGRHNTVAAATEGLTTRKFHMRRVTVDVTYAFISPSLDMLEGVEEWLTVAGFEELQCSSGVDPVVCLYPGDEDLSIRPTIDVIETGQFAFPSGPTQGTVSSLEVTMRLQYQATIRADLQDLITEINKDFYITEKESDE